MASEACATRECHYLKVYNRIGIAFFNVLSTPPFTILLRLSTRNEATRLYKYTDDGHLLIRFHPALLRMNTSSQNQLLTSMNMSTFLIKNCPFQVNDIV